MAKDELITLMSSNKHTGFIHFTRYEYLRYVTNYKHTNIAECLDIFNKYTCVLNSVKQGVLRMLSNFKSTGYAFGLKWINHLLDV